MAKPPTVYNLHVNTDEIERRCEELYRPIGIIIDGLDAAATALRQVRVGMGEIVDAARERDAAEKVEE